MVKGDQPNSPASRQGTQRALTVAERDNTLAVIADQRRKNPAYGRQRISTDADSRTDTILERLRDYYYLFFLNNPPSLFRCNLFRCASLVMQISVTEGS